MSVIKYSLLVFSVQPVTVIAGHRFALALAGSDQAAASSGKREPDIVGGGRQSVYFLAQFKLL